MRENGAVRKLALSLLLLLITIAAVSSAQDKKPEPDAVPAAELERQRDVAATHGGDAHGAFGDAAHGDAIAGPRDRVAEDVESDADVADACRRECGRFRCDLCCSGRDRIGGRGFHGKSGIRLNGRTIPKLFPGEKFGIQNAARPAAQFGEFEKACLRNIASGLGLSYEQLSQDWSSTNYSSARAALIEVWRGFNRSRTRFAEQFATPWYMLWMEEAIDRGDLKLPKGGPDFYEAKGAYCRAKWIGPPRGWVDPVKEGQAAQIRMDSLLSTLEEECAEQGRDYEEVLDQVQRENLMLKERGLTRATLTAKVLAPGEEAPESLVGDANGNSGSKNNG